jgi:hypothetical protein
MFQMHHPQVFQQAHLLDHTIRIHRLLGNLLVMVLEEEEEEEEERNYSIKLQLSAGYQKTTLGSFLLAHLSFKMRILELARLLS